MDATVEIEVEELVEVELPVEVDDTEAVDEVPLVVEQLELPQLTEVDDTVD